MKAVFLLAMVGASVAIPVIPDAPDVAAEKARFFAAFDAAHAAALPQPGQPITPPKWYGPLASTVPAGVPGSSSNVALTADLSSARDEFFRTYNAQLASVGGGETHRFAVAAPGWTGPLASAVPAGVPGSSPIVADTAEVAAARAAFINAYNQQVQATAVRV